MEELLENMIKNMKNSNDNNEKFSLLENIITLESDYENYRKLLYKDIKKWLYLYIKVNQNKNFTYDEIVFDKVLKKIELVPIEQKIPLVNYFIRLLNKEFLIEEISIYENYKKDLEIKSLKEEKKYFSYLIKLSTKNLSNLLYTLIVSLIFFAIVWFNLNSFSPEKFPFKIVDFVGDRGINYFINILYILFSFEDTQLKTIYELFLIGSIKLYFYVLITYFLVKEISKKINSI
ncbi:hypothetical protein [Malaciobacter marinus]|uniref:Uncharacterized protein n=2 Tax=Malaciobacter marinus TaxID=505249 RepID=A0ABX4LUR9_9BACT|nr:hypothetical protein [Malaciobacter marinus]PHO14403.1 hypothetical protein CPH92_12090 [Malaciobacter marinus]